MPKTIAEHVVVMRLVTTSGQFIGSLTSPWATKNAPPRPINRNVGTAIPSVSRVRMVYIACGI